MKRIIRIKRKSGVIDKNILDNIKYDDNFSDELLSNNNVISLKIKTSDGIIKIIKFGKCHICRKKTLGSEHHIIPRENNGSDDNENKIFLCQECHDDVEINCEICKDNINQLCNKQRFINCWFSGYPIHMKGCYKMTKKTKKKSVSEDIYRFKCIECNKKLIRTSLWDKENYLSNEWFATFKCIDCDKTYDIKMSKDIMNWVIDNVEVSLNKTT